MVLKRVGWVLAAIGILDVAVTIFLFRSIGPYPALPGVSAVAAGGCLLRGGPRSALWVRMLAIFLLAAGLMLAVAVPFFQPLSLTLVEIRLDLQGFAEIVVPGIVILAVLFGVTWELGRRSVLDAIASSGIRRWDARIAAQAGGGVALLSCLMLWLALHGQSAELAESLALQQLGPSYRYHLSWISSSNNGHGTSVSGVVTAWNSTEIRKVLLHWETH